MPALHEPPAKPSEIQRWSGALALAIEARCDALSPHSIEGRVMQQLLESVVEARKQMGWA